MLRVSWDCRLWMLREISPGSYEKVDVLIHRELGEKEHENSQQPGIVEGLEEARCPITPAAATVLSLGSRMKSSVFGGCKFSLRIPRKKQWGPRDPDIFQETAINSVGIRTTSSDISANQTSPEKQYYAHKLGCLWVLEAPHQQKHPNKTRGALIRHIVAG